MLYQSTHRIRTQEKKLIKRIFLTFLIILAVAIFSLYVGLPVLAKIIVLLSSIKTDKTTQNISANSILFPPVLNPLPEATNSSKIKLSGFSQADTDVLLTINDGKEQKIQLEKDGTFVSKSIDLRVGSNTIVAYTIKNGQTSDASSSAQILYKKEGPQIEITSPSENDKISSDNPNIVISGNTEAEAKLTINGHIVIVGNSGKFSYNTKLSEGENEYKFEATDIAGNKSTQSLKINYSP